MARGLSGPPMRGFGMLGCRLPGGGSVKAAAKSLTSSFGVTLVKNAVTFLDARLFGFQHCGAKTRTPWNNIGIYWDFCTFRTSQRCIRNAYFHAYSQRAGSSHFQVLNVKFAATACYLPRELGTTSLLWRSLKGTTWGRNCRFLGKGFHCVHWLRDGGWCFDNVRPLW